MKINLDNYKKAFANLPAGVLSAEINAELSDNIHIEVSEGRKSGTSLSMVTALFVKVKSGSGRTGYAYTEQLDEYPYSVINRALDNAAVLKNATAFRIDKPLNKNKQMCFFLENEDKCSIKDIYSKAADLEKLTLEYDERIKSVSNCSIRKSIIASRVLNSEGLDMYSENVVYRAEVTALASTEKGVFDGTAGITASSLAELDLKKIAERAVTATILKISSQNFSSGTYNALLSNEVTKNIITTLWQAFSASNMYSGETIFSEKFGEIIGLSILSIIDAPDHPECGYKFPFDCEGTLVKKKYLVRKGCFENMLHTLSTADEFEAEPTGNAGRYALLSCTIPTQAVITPKVLYIEPGEKTVKELLEELNEGIYITYSADLFHSINITSGDFSIPCGGVVIKNGKYAYSVEQLTMTGNIADLLCSIIEVGNDLDIDEFLRRSYCIGGPSILVKSLKVSGR